MRHNSMRSTRARRAVFAVAFAVVAIAWSADRVVVEDWRSYPTGTRGIPGGDWKEQSWGKAVYDLEIVSDNGQPVLHLRSKGKLRRSIATSRLRSIPKRRQSSSGDGRS